MQFGEMKLEVAKQLENMFKSNLNKKIKRNTYMKKAKKVY